MEHASLQIYQQRLSARLSGSLHTKLLFPDKRSRFTERRTDACRHHWRYFVIKYMYTTTRACTLIVNVSVIIEPFHQYSRNGNLSTSILIPTLPKPTAYFSVISSWRPPGNMENVYAMPMYLFLITGSEHDETIYGLMLITNVNSEGSGEPAH